MVHLTATKREKFLKYVSKNITALQYPNFYAKVTMRSLFLATKVLSTLLFQYIYTQVVVFFWCSEITLHLLTSLLTATKHHLL